MNRWTDSIVQASVWRERAYEMLTEYQRLHDRVQEAVALLDFQANLGPPEHQATLREVVRQLTAALDSGAMSES